MKRFIISFLLIFLIASFTVTANAQKIILDIVSKNEVDIEFIDKNDNIFPVELNLFTIYALTDKYNDIVAITTNNTITLEKLNLGYSLSVLYSNEKNSSNRVFIIRSYLSNKFIYIHKFSYKI